MSGSVDRALSRYSLNQATTKSWPLTDVVAASAGAGLHWIGLWREPVQAYGVDKAAKLVERMEKEGVVGPPSAKAGGRREVLIQPR